jgi:hypothetical protein
MEFYYNTPFVFKIPQYLKNRVSTNIYIFKKGWSTLVHLAQYSRISLLNYFPAPRGPPLSACVLRKTEV